jgi:hypothetical protein
MVISKKKSYPVTGLGGQQEVVNIKMALGTSGIIQYLMLIHLL